MVSDGKLAKVHPGCEPPTIEICLVHSGRLLLIHKHCNLLPNHIINGKVNHTIPCY